MSESSGSGLSRCKVRSRLAKNGKIVDEESRPDLVARCVRLSVEIPKPVHTDEAPGCGLESE